MFVYVNNEYNVTVVACLIKVIMSFRVIEQAYHYMYNINKQGRLIFNQRQVPWVAFAELLRY